jgi:hypothetical protein
MESGEDGDSADTIECVDLVEVEKDEADEASLTISWRGWRGDAIQHPNVCFPVSPSITVTSRSIYVSLHSPARSRVNSVSFYLFSLRIQVRVPATFTSWWGNTKITIMYMQTLFLVCISSTSIRRVVG